MKKWYKKRYLIMLGIFILINITLGFLLRTFIPALLDCLQIYNVAICQFITSNYVMSAVSYIVLYIIGAMLALPATSGITLAGGFLFGRFWGGLYAIIGATLGGACAFLIARTVWGKHIQYQYASELASVNEQLTQHGIFYLLLIRVLPFVPFSLFNIVISVTTISARQFIWTTALGIIPNAFIYAHLGSTLQACKTIAELKSSSFIAPLIIIALLAVGPFAWPRIKKLFNRK